MRTARAAAALLALGLAACTGSSRDGVRPSSTSTPASSASTTSPASKGCPTDKAEVAALFDEAIVRAEGSTGSATAQVCSFGTSATDLGALSVAYLRFPRADLEATTLAQAKRRYGSTLAGHTVVAMPSWGAGAFLDESQLPDQNVTAEFAWIAGYEIILGMHSDDTHAAKRRELIDRLVSFARTG